jgi:pimeloyl-ACP methyl ester carboxylesterase
MTFTARARLGLGLASVAAVGASLLSPTPGATAAPVAATRTASAGVDAPVPVIAWHRCGPASPERLRCASVEVPRDYDAPEGRTITLSVVKLMAARPAQRIGSLFVNPGGPGGPSTEFVLPAAQLLGPVARRRFDIIGVDPRGVGGSTPAVCTLTDAHWPRVAFPMNQRQVKRQLAFGRDVRRGCAETGNAILDHMTTADTARDMDLVRQAVGDEQLTYYGISYGSYLGATYAAMFPDQVRAVIVDGILDPVAWSTGRGDAAETLPFSTRVASGQGAAETLDAALTECNRVGARRCALAPRAHAKWDRIEARVRKDPLRLNGGALRYSDLIGNVLGAMYDKEAYPYLMRDLQSLHQALGNRGGRRVALAAAVDSLRELAERARADRPGGPWAALTTTERARYGASFEGVACADSVNPTDPRAWARAAVVDDRRGGGGFGRLWTWASSACAGWPGSSADAYRGPWDVPTAAPILVVGNTHDPATPYTGALALHDVLPSSRLVTLDTWGHGSLGQSRCVTDLFSDYLADQTLPAGDVRCRADHALFPSKPRR